MIIGHLLKVTRLDNVIFKFVKKDTKCYFYDACQTCRDDHSRQGIQDC